MSELRPDEAEMLIDAHLAGEIDDDGRTRLRAWLLADRAHLRRYLRDVRFDQDLSALTRARAERHEHGYASTRFERTPRLLRGPRRWTRVAAIAAILALCLGGYAAWQAIGAMPAAPQIALAAIAGDARVERGGAAVPTMAPGAALAVGDSLVARGDGRATARFVDGTLATVTHGALALDGSETGKRLTLSGGQVLIRAAKQPPGRPLVVETSLARAEVVGTTLTVSDEPGLTTLAVAEGTVAFADRRGGAPRAVAAGMRDHVGPEVTSATRPGRPGQRGVDPYLGVELGPMHGPGHELAFTDLFRHAMPFQPLTHQGQTAVIGTPLDGWVTSVSPGGAAATLMLVGDGGHYPGGAYVCTWTGSGTVDCGGDAHVVTSQPHRLELEVTPQDHGGILLTVADIDPADPPRDIHLVAAAQAEGERWRQHPFQEAYLARWRGCGVLRAQAWEDSGHDGHELSWSARRAPGSGPTQVAAPAETLLDLAGELDADLWLTVPVEADDSYVAGLAELVHRRLGEGRRVYLEYGHDAWDAADINSRWVRERGLAKGYGADVALERAYLDRALAIFAAWRRVFADDPRLVRVLNLGNADGEALARRLAWSSAADQADALALDLGLGARLDPALAEAPDLAERAGEAMRADAAAVLALAERARAVARAHGLRVIGYHASADPDFAGPVAPAAHGRLFELVDMPAAAAALAELIRGWRAAGGDLLCVDLPHQLIHQRAPVALGEMPVETPLATWRVLVDALPPVTPAP